MVCLPTMLSPVEYRVIPATITWQRRSHSTDYRPGYCRC